MVKQREFFSFLIRRMALTMFASTLGCQPAGWKVADSEGDESEPSTNRRRRPHSGAVLITCLHAAKNSKDKDKDWWEPVSKILKSPCSPSTQDDMRNISCDPRSSLPVNTTEELTIIEEEAYDLVKQLLNMKQTKKWISGNWAQEAEDLRRNLTTCVPRPPTRGKPLYLKEIKAVEELVQVVSYAHYLKVANESDLKENKFKEVRNTVSKLHKKLLSLACKLAETFPLNPQCYVNNNHVTKDDIPKGLLVRHKKRKALAVLYICFEKIEEFFRQGSCSLCVPQ